jgi:hypothetical protein
MVAETPFSSLSLSPVDKPPEFDQGPSITLTPVQGNPFKTAAMLNPDLIEGLTTEGAPISHELGGGGFGDVHGYEEEIGKPEEVQKTSPARLRRDERFGEAVKGHEDDEAHKGNLDAAMQKIQYMSPDELDRFINDASPSAP